MSDDLWLKLARVIGLLGLGLLGLEPVMHFFRASNVTAYHCILASLLHGVWTTWVANRNSPNEGLPEANQGKSGCKVHNRL